MARSEHDHARALTSSDCLASKQSSLGTPGADGQDVKRRQQVGFSIVEAMITLGVLGVTVSAITTTYVNAVHGYARNQALAEAVEVASQRAESIATLAPATVPACSGAALCKDGDTMTAPLTSVGGFDCSLWVDGAAVSQPGGAPRAGQRFRVDTVVSAHPDAVRQPDARLVTVSVCWTDTVGTVHEVQTRRLMVPGA